MLLTSEVDQVDDQFGAALFRAPLPLDEFFEGIPPKHVREQIAGTMEALLLRARQARRAWTRGSATRSTSWCGS